MYLKPWRPQSCSCNLFSGYEESWMERSEASDDAVFWKETEGEKVNVCVSLRTFKDGRGLIHLGKIMPHLLVCSIIYLKSDMFRHSPTAQPTAELSQLVHPSPAHLPLCTHISLSLSTCTMGVLLPCSGVSCRPGTASLCKTPAAYELHA